MCPMGNNWAPNQMKKIFTFLLMLFLSRMTFAQVSVWDGSWEPWTHGTGTEADPFLIENAQQLAYLAYRVNNGLDAGGGHVSNHNLHYKLMVDVNLNGSEDFQWTPIGYWNSDTDYQCFGGHFDGNNHTISNLFINSSANRVGFFGYTDGSVVHNTTINGTKISSSGSIAGGIIGVANGTIITNCISDLIDGISCSQYAGGIVGVYYCTSSTQAIINCYNTGNINTNYISGGIVGQIGLNCNNGGNNLIITNNFNIGIVSALWRGGGIVGYVIGENYCNNLVIITNCFNIGNVLCSTNYSSNSSSGGIVGSSNSSNILFTNISSCYNTGMVSASLNKGGIIGFGACNILNSYFLNSCGGDNTYGGQPMSADAMKTQEFVGTLNNGSCAWEYDSNNTNLGYPVLTMLFVDVVTSDATGVLATSAVLKGSVFTENASVLSQGFEYKKVSDYNYQTINASGNGNISQLLSGLQPDTQYQYRAFCTTNNCGSHYGVIKTFSTTPVFVTTGYATDVTTTSAILHGSISLGDATLASKGFEYRAIGETDYNIVNVEDNHNPFSTQITGLQLNTTYEYRTFLNIIESPMTYYGETKTFEVTWLNQDTIFINNAEMLRWVSEQCNSGTTFQGKYIKLMNDITLPLNVPNNMTSIGSYPNYPFKGTFDGNGKHITNLYIDQPNTPYQGFFGYTLNANLYNVGLVNITASGRNYTGGMVAYAENTYMRDCYVNGGTLFALSYCGGLVGYQQQGTNSIISGCYNTCEVTGNNYVGGLVGFSNYSTVRNSYVAAMVAAQGEAVGSIIGGANEVLMYYCYFNSELTGQTNAIGWNNTGKDGGEAMTSAQMRDPQFVATLNQGLTVHVWKQDYTKHINNGFPILQWQQSTGVDENEALAVSIYPNPTNGHATVEAEDLKHISICNMLGQTVFDDNANGDIFEYDFSKHATGLYLIKIETTNGVALKKVSVVR